MSGNTRKAKVDELFGVELTMEVLAAGDGCREMHTGGVDGLEDAVQVTATSDFLDKDGRQTLGAQLLVNTEEVDLAAILGSASNQAGVASVDLNKMTAHDGKTKLTNLARAGQ